MATKHTHTKTEREREKRRDTIQKKEEKLADRKKSERTASTALALLLMEM